MAILYLFMLNNNNNTDRPISDMLIYSLHIKRMIYM